MKQREITATGTINANGGLVMYMGELNAFFAMHKGQKVIARFMVSEPGSSEALKGYYYHYVVPTIRKGLWEMGDRKTDEQTERFLRELTPICYEETINTETGEYNHRLREVPELSNAELLEHIDAIRIFAGEELGVFIDDPKTI